MRHTHFFSFMAAMSMMLLFASCQKNKLNDRKHGQHPDEPTQYVTINKTISYGELYTLDLSPYEDEDDISNITQQATKYSISELSGLASTKNNMYSYSLNAVQKNFVGQTTTSGVSANGPTTATASTLTNSSSQQQIVITVTEGEHFQNNHQGGCMGGNSNNQSHVGEVEAVITINLTIQ